MIRAAAQRWALGTATAVLVGGGFALGLNVGNLHNGLIAASFGAVGLYVVHRRPGSREGWLFVAVGVTHAVMFAGRQYGLHSGPLPGASWIGWLGVWPLPLVLVLVGVAVMCFPTGRLPSRGWVPVLGVLAAMGLVLSTVSALWPVEYGRTGLVAGHPLDLPGFSTADAFYRVARPVGYLLFQLTWVACVVARVRRARGDEARQLRWFLYSATMSAAVMVLGLAVWGSPIPGTLTAPLLAVAAGAAILRYRLYDIDPVINKSLVFGAMAVLVTLGYAVVVTGMGRLVSGYGNLLSLLATGLVAVIFEPLRRRAQRLADRVVYGRRASPYEALARLSAHFTAPAGGLLDGICATVADAVGAHEVTLWTGPADTLRAVSVWPTTTSLPTGSRTFADLVAVPVRHDGRFRGAITVTKAPGDTLSIAEQRVVGDLAAQAGLVLELRATAQRLVAAGDAARRRLERDLHDGAQQRLVNVAMELGRVVRLATTAGAAEVAAQADDVRRQLLDATAELRELARGLHPAVLTQDGLEAAISFLADRSPLPVRLTVLVARRLSAEVESTAYFVVSEGLTNAAKHSGADAVTVRVVLAGASLVTEISDDGCGGAATRPGSGLEGLADRLATLDARLTVESGPAGTHLKTVIPCG
ncbi:signal transduction histidine kinase [Allocatelliglobosispora scoriae]|uniref:histidine kinase n=1 Tax=Allocatelliglobosispora scoriae TaxID=643052 RepID=A0A841BG73_9ACTN|nr:histidine kinase [Allocatelliglobosispora scoriae]MBB5868087.1 signal transduction histidine kinase [Allocatelliglobosispora scoriae]